MQSLRRSLATHGARSFARGGAGAPAPVAFFPPAASTLLNHRRGKSTEALADDLVKACDDLLAAGKRINWIFLGAPGVGKGTYATRISKLMKIPHISAGDLVRDEIKRGTARGAEMEAITSTGQLLPDSVILDILKDRVQRGIENGERGFLLDGFPRTAAQAAALKEFAEVQQVLNLGLREDILVEKCCARRLCKECGKNFNIADINYPGDPPIVMPPLNPPKGCEHKMEQRKDDTEEVVKARLKVYKDNAKPVEDFYEKEGKLAEFQIVSGIPETMPVLLTKIIGIVKASK
jgi:adenylate kinase|tara:strand:+ start:2790 stop:3665 length:876 start_codon:yes stop_codon:yes gene_type:complete|mmetsp:Transcript_5267/g.18960  ORF Transcript_5267/g.18960 Transcript_5267/m.18960 type:complete len:292 (-) Transcript_5267:31-906(-)